MLVSTATTTTGRTVDTSSVSTEYDPLDKRRLTVRFTVTFTTYHSCSNRLTQLA